MKATIKTIPDFIELLNNRKLTSKQICEILEKGFDVFADESLSPEKLKSELIRYWEQNQYTKDKPIFLDGNIKVEEYLESQLVIYKRKGFLREYKTRRSAKIASLFYTTGMSGNTIFLLGKPIVDFI